MKPLLDQRGMEGGQNKDGGGQREEKMEEGDRDIRSKKGMMSAVQIDRREGERLWGEGAQLERSKVTGDKEHLDD